jgi:hypothetical protein
MVFTKPSRMVEVLKHSSQSRDESLNHTLNRIRWDSISTKRLSSCNRHSISRYEFNFTDARLPWCNLFAECITNMYR